MAGSRTRRQVQNPAGGSQDTNPTPGTMVPDSQLQAQLSQDSGTEASPAGIREETEPIPERVQSGTENTAVPFSIFERLMQTQNEAFLRMLKRVNRDNGDRSQAASYSK